MRIGITEQTNNIDLKMTNKSMYLSWLVGVIHQHSCILSRPVAEKFIVIHIIVVQQICLLV